MHTRIAVAIGICVGIADVPIAASSLRTVVLSDDQMPGQPSEQTFQYFAPPLLNDLGQTAFFSGFAFEQFPSPAPSLPAGDRVWSEGSGTLSLIASPLSTVPGALENVTFGFFNQLGFNNGGKTVIRANLRGAGVTSGSNDFATYIEATEGLELVSRSGDPAPGLPGEVFGPLQTLLLNDAGQVAFLCDVGTSFGDPSIWMGKLGSINLVAKSGDVIPGTSTRVLGLRAPVLNDSGEVAFSTSQAYGIWSGDPGSLNSVAKSGEVAPGADGDVFAILLDPAINNSGHVAFYATLSGTTNQSGIWSDRSGDLNVVILAGDPAQAPSGDVVFNNLHGPVLNDAEHIAFWAQLAGSGVTDANDTGIWSDASGSIALAAGEGGPAPGVSESLLFGEFDRRSYGLNELGQIAFLGSVTGDGITTANDVGIWATDQFGELHLIAREGDVLEVRPNELRTISQLWFFTESGNADSRPSGFNNLGQLAFLARFTDSTEGIFVSNLVAVNLPEPPIFPGDYNGDDTVDAADYVVWRKTLGHIVPQGTAADGNGDGTIDPQDYNVWRTNFGNRRPNGAGSSAPAVPEPSGNLLLVLAFGIVLAGMRTDAGTVAKQKRA